MEPPLVDWFRIIWWLVWGWQSGAACLTGQLTDFSLVFEMFSRYLGSQCCKDLNEEAHKSINCYVILFAAWEVQLENHSSLALSMAVFFKHMNDLLQRSYCFIGSFCRLNWSYMQWWWTVLLAICIFLILFKVWTFNKLEKIYKQVADLTQCIYIILCIAALLAHTGQTTSSLCTVL